MSFIADDDEHEIAVETSFDQILIELKAIRRLLEVLVGVGIDEFNNFGDD